MMSTPILATIASGLQFLAINAAIGLSVALGMFTGLKVVEGMHDRLTTWTLRRKRERETAKQSKNLTPVPA